jgi:hypothetical protein
MRWWWLLLVACGPMSTTEYSALDSRTNLDNTHAQADAVGAWRKGHVGYVDLAPHSVELANPAVDHSATSHTPVARPAPSPVGFQPGEQLVIDPATSQVGFASIACLENSGCGCGMKPAYMFLRSPAGRVTILRVTATFHDRVVHLASCGYGCGTAPPDPAREPLSVAELGIEDPALVDVAEVRYDHVRLVEHCDHSIPVP